MRKMVEIRIHGRGGQGSVTAAELLARAAFYDGHFTQAFPSFGVERRGAPLEAFCRISNEPILLREQIYHPHFLIIQDATLLDDESVLQGINKDVSILINSQNDFSPHLKAKAVLSVPATQIALKIIGKPFFNTAILGAFCAMSGLVSVASLERVISEHFPVAIASVNVASMKEGYRVVKEGSGEVKL